MKRLYITFSGAQYDTTTVHIWRTPPRWGPEYVKIYDDKWLMRSDFYRHNEWLWHTPGMRGFGWFAWKPYVIMHALENFCEPGDIVLYTDADTYPIADLAPLYDRCAQDGGCMLFAAQGCSNRQWVKLDCWEVMAARIDCAERRGVFIDTQHATARFMLFQAGAWKPRQLLMEWLTYCVNPLATTFHKSTFGEEFIGFEEHRTEQAILSLLAHKYGYHLYREACQFGNAALAEQGVDSWYPQLFVQDGTKGESNLEKGSAYRNVAVG